MVQKHLASVAAVLLLGASACVREQQTAGTPGGGQAVQALTMRTAGPDLPALANVVAPSHVIPADFTNSPLVEVYGNFRTAGIVVGLPAGSTAKDVGHMRAFLNIGGAWSRVQDPVQVGSFPWFASSLFWLAPASTYQVKVEVLDPSGFVRSTVYGEGATRAEPRIDPAGPRVFVAPDGNDAHAGTLARPYRTLARALSEAKAGTTVLLRKGTYYEGGLRLPVSGTAEAPVVVRGYPGERVVVSGADPGALDPAGWTSEDGGLYSFPGTGSHTGTCVEDLNSGRMIRLFDVPSLDELKAGRINGIGTFAELGIAGGAYGDGTRVYVKLPADLTHYRMYISRQSMGLDLTGRQHVQVDGLSFDHFGLDQPSCALHVENASDILIQQCQFRYDDCQIYVKGTSARLTVQDCRFVDGILDWPFGYLKSGPGRYFEGGAVDVDASYSGRGMVIRRNHVEGLFDGMHLTPWTVCDARTSETDFYENTMDGCIDDFMELDGFSRNVRVFDNYLSRSLSGISLAQALDGPTYIAYNVLANCGDVAAAKREGNYGYPFKTNGGPSMEIGSGPIYFYHNTAHTQDPESRAMLVKLAKWRLITMRNNIWCGEQMGADFWRPAISPMDFDYDNLYVAETNGPLVRIEYEQRVNTLAEVRARFGWLAHGLSEDPRLREPAQGDYRLSDGSPCIDAGTLVAGINETRMRGAAPDLGAYEAR
ncbi:MAG: right-handed parallel beta-helix repeat-containing protein [Lentisphaerae bacterium]|nr:right-handed parallel beta-helix repeat-containing protein [Lentisphaerota bacterium]